jgi:F-type H+-transporting ATPase subunit epsilon
MNMKLITLGGTLVDRDIYEIVVPTAEGEIGVFPGHEPLVTIAVPGALVIRYGKGDADAKLDYFAISGGVVKVSPQDVQILVDEAHGGDDISEADAKVALERAIKMRDSAKSQIELDEAHQLVDRHAVRLKVAELRRHRRR